MGVADIGPLAVRQGYQRQGIGAKIMSSLEQEFPVTAVGVVSCRSARLKLSLSIIKTLTTGLMFCPGIKREVTLM